jgi:hypothetical protein
MNIILLLSAAVPQKCKNALSLGEYGCPCDVSNRSANEYREANQGLSLESLIKYGISIETKGRIHKALKG